jgi:hypothetical protein
MIVYVVTDEINIRNEDSAIYQLISRSFAARDIKSRVFSDVDFYNQSDNVCESDIVILANSNFYFLQRQDFENFIIRIPALKIYMGFDDEYMINTSLYYSRYVDLMVTFDLVTYEYFRSLAIPVLCCPHPVMVPVVTKDSKLNFDVSFVGRVDNLKPERIKILQRLEEEFPNSYFPGLSGRWVPDDEMANIFFNSKVNLSLTGITNYGSDINLMFNSQRRGFKGRPFEIGAAGGFCLSEFSPSIELFLKKGVEIDYFYSLDDLIGKVKFYLCNHAQRNKMAGCLKSKILKLYSADSDENHLITHILKINNDKATIRLSCARFSDSVSPPSSFTSFNLESQRLLHNLHTHEYKIFLAIFNDIFKANSIKSISLMLYIVKLILLKFIRIVRGGLSSVVTLARFIIKRVMNE